MATITAVILTGKRQIRADGLSNVKIRIYHNRRLEYISTDLYVDPDKFRNGRLYGDGSEWVNSRIIDYMKQYTDRYMKLSDKSERMTAHEIKDALKSGFPERIDFLKFATDHMEDLKQSGRLGSWRQVSGLVSNLKAFKKDIYFDEINAQWLQAFERFMVARGCNHSVSNYMISLRAIFNQGRRMYNDEDRGVILIPNYPFKKYRIPKKQVRTKENALTVEQLKTLLNYRAEYPREILAVDVCRAMVCLMGLNAKDLYSLTRVKNDRVEYTRAKTGYFFSVKIEPELRQVIKAYRGKGRVFSFSEMYKDDQLFLKAVNIGLSSIFNKIHANAKRLSQKIDLPKRITTNWIRHTWATIARNDCGVSKDDVALCLGHRDMDNVVTDIYIRYDNRIQDEVNRKVLDLLFKKT